MKKFALLACVIAAAGGWLFVRKPSPADRIATAVEALPAPASFRAVTAFAAGGPSVETLLTGEVATVPVLEYRVRSVHEAKDLGWAFHDYVRANGRR